MNWKTIKTFLIFLFLAVNIFLLFVNYKSYNMAKLSDRTIADTLTLLEKNNISISASAIPRNAAEHNNIQLTNLYYSVSGNSYKSSMTFTEDGMILLTLPADDIPSNKNDLSEYIKKKLSHNSFDINNIHIEQTDDVYTMTYKVNNLPVFNNQMTITPSKEALELHGTWYVHEKESTYTAVNSGHIYATSALTELISHPARNPDEKLNITNIDTGYYADVTQKAENIKIISASPCYRLTTDTDKVYYYSITDNKFIN